MKNFITSVLTVGILAMAVPHAAATTFWPGHVINVDSDDELNIRKWPASHSRKIGALPNKAPISLTGRCKNTSNNKSFRVDGGEPTGWKFSKMEQPKVWCQVVTDEGEVGWVRGKFVWPK